MNRLRRWGMAAVLGALAMLVWVGPAAAAPGISGRVVDTANQPLEGIEVCSHSIAYVAPAPGCTRTDSNGEYSIPGGAFGEIVQFLAPEQPVPGYAPQFWPGVPSSGEAQRVTEADREHIDATMGPGGTVSGKIVSRATSLPIEGVRVCPDPVVFSEGQGYRCADTDAAGEFTLGSLAGVEYRLGLRTEHDVNFVETVLGPIQVHPGGTVETEASLVPGFEIEGTVTEAGTGLPVGAAIPLPRDGTMVCAVDSVTEERVKCSDVNEMDGHYSIPGIPPGRTVGVTFGVDYIAEGYDLGEDGYVRRYWDEVPNWSEAAFISGSGGSTFGGIDAQLTQGEEVFPRCEVKSACATPQPPTTIVEPPSIPAPPAISEPHSYVPGPSASTAPARPSAVNCKAGFRRVIGLPEKKCVKVEKPYNRKKHRRPVHPRRHTPAHR